MPQQSLYWFAVLHGRIMYIINTSGYQSTLTWVHMDSECLENSGLSVMTDLMSHFGDLCQMYVYPCSSPLPVGDTSTKANMRPF